MENTMLSGEGTDGWLNKYILIETVDDLRIYNLAYILLTVYAITYINYNKKYIIKVCGYSVFLILCCIK